MNSVAATAPTHAKPATDRCRMLSILLPVRNEGINLRIMLKILRAVVDLPHEVLVVYDSAGDDSVVVVNDVRQIYPELRGIQNTLGHGVVNAIRAGVGASEGDVILIFAADEVGPVLAIEDMIALIRDGCDFVSCTRYAHGGRRLGGSLIGAFPAKCQSFRSIASTAASPLSVSGRGWWNIPAGFFGVSAPISRTKVCATKRQSESRNFIDKSCVILSRERAASSAVRWCVRS